MAVAMETAAWRGAEVLDVKKERAAWGADAQQLMQMMLGQLRSEPASMKPAAELSTLDLLGKAEPCSSARQLDSELHLSSPDFLELDPEEPLPSGWEKCLDLQVEFHHLDCATFFKDSGALYAELSGSRVGWKFLSVRLPFISFFLHWV